MLRGPCTLSFTLLMLASGAHAHHGSTPAAASFGNLQQPQVRQSVAGLSTRLDRVRSRTTRGVQVVSEAFGQYRLARRFAAGLAVPWLHIRPDGGQSEWGLGDLGASLKAGYGSSAAHTGVGVLELRFPTQSVRLGADPGRVWVLQVISSNSWLFRRFTVLASPGLAADYRPAGTALDAQLSGFIESQIGAGFTPGLGVDARVRLATWCFTQAGTSVFCAAGRASDAEGRLLSHQASVVPRLAFRCDENTTVSASVTLPVLPERIGGFSAELGAVVSF